VGLGVAYVNAGDDCESARLPPLLDLEKTLLELLKLVLGDDSVLGVGASESNVVENALLVEDTVEVDTLVVLDHAMRGSRPPEGRIGGQHGAGVNEAS
jgi:hypothetical protein